MQTLWCPMLIARAVRTAVPRYGGDTLPRRVVPVAVGLMLGDTTGGWFWARLGVLSNRSCTMVWE